MENLHRPAWLSRGHETADGGPASRSGQEVLRSWWTLRWVRWVVLFLFYLGIILALLLIYGRGDFTTAPFVYQGF